MTLDNDDDNNQNCSVLLLCNEIWEIIIDFLHILVLVNLTFVCTRLREIALLNKKMEHYFTYLNRIFCLNVYNQSLKECFDLIFDRLSVYFDLADKLYFQYRVFSLFRVFSIDHYFKFVFPESVFSKNVAKIFSSEKNRRFGLKNFYESRRIYETIKSNGKKMY